MRVCVVYWTDCYIGDMVHYSPLSPWKLFEFEDRQKAEEHLRADYFVPYKDDRDVYLCSYRHVKTFAKIIAIDSPEPPRKSLCPPGTITH